METINSALTAILGAAVALLLSNIVGHIESFLVPIAAGGFIYIAGSDLIPELHKDSDKLGRSLLQLIAFVVGVLIMVALLLLD